MFKVGDEVSLTMKMVEIGSTYVIAETKNGAHIYLDRNVFENNAEEPKTYTQGLADAWELARKIVLDKDRGGFSCSELESIFDTVYPSDILEKLSYEEVLAKIEAYEKEREIKVGDVVKVDELACVVTAVYKDSADVLFKDGTCENSSKIYIEKTGKHIDIEPLLRQIGE